jgi:transposase
MKTNVIQRLEKAWWRWLTPDQTLWGSFITILEEVAVIRGVRVVKVNQSNTSQDCSGCGVKVKKDLSIQCPKR